MSIHKLTAGSGYDYLTRQVAAQDATEKGHTSLASYYTAKGEAPGTWIGSGMAGIDGLDEGDEVTAEQMRNLFGAGRHPLAEQLRVAAADGRDERAGAGDRDVAGQPVPGLRQRRLGVPDPGGQGRSLPCNAASGDAPLTRCRWPTGRGSAPTSPPSCSASDHGREPADARELAATIAKHSRPRTNAVAGYDLTFSPVKSVSALWAIADRPDRGRDRAGPPRRGQGRAGVPGATRPCSPGRAPTASGRSRPAAWSPPRSPIATPAPATPTFTPMSRSPTRSRPSTTVGGWRSTGGCCSPRRSLRRRPTTPRWSGT